MSDASVAILQNRLDPVSKKRKDILLKADVTKANGEFGFSELPMFGALKLKITAIGFKPVEQTVTFEPKMAPGSADAMSAMAAFDKDLGNIKLSTDAKVLQGVTVTTNAAGLKLDIDKKVFNVKKI